MTVRLGADGTGSNVAELQSLGATFICRYTSEQSWALTLPEAQRLSAAGLDIVSNYEHYTTDYQGGYSQGETNARTAWRVHKAAGGPDGRPIYFSVDTNVDPNDTNLHQYFAGAGAALTGAKQVGVYGSTGVCNALKAAGLVQWTWRTMSTGWHGGGGLPSMFNIEQTGYLNSVYDRDASITDDFGQWRIGVTPTPSGGGGTPPAPSERAVSLAVLQMCAKEDPPAPQGHTTNFNTVYLVQRALEAVGVLDPKNKWWGRGAYGTMTVAAYAGWQHVLGYTGADADGIPGMTSLTALAKKTGLFTVTA